ncbi:MAG TPA: hypothetical protein VGT61_13370 [Thermomicrobiales bacterium]|jgi:thiol-disulfide isomerase/thioredoxin|nr:hypothetical protein [Thermomicrobiales bacterium]
MSPDRNPIARIAIPIAGPAAAALFLVAAWLGGLTGFVAGIAVIAIAVAVVLRVRLRRVERELAAMRASLAEFDVTVTPLASAVPPVDPAKADVGLPPVAVSSAGDQPAASAAPAGQTDAATSTHPTLAVSPGHVDDEATDPATPSPLTVPSTEAAGESDDRATTSDDSIVIAASDDETGEDQTATGTATDEDESPRPATPGHEIPPRSMVEAPVPDAMPDIEVQALSGDTVRADALGDPHGRPAVVVFWRPDCGPSVRLTPELVAWASLQGPRLIVVAACDAPTAFRAGLPGMVLLDPAFRVGRALGATGTPAAISIDGQGLPTSGLVAGASAINAHLLDAMREWASADHQPTDDVVIEVPVDEPGAAETAPYGPPIPLAMLLRRVEPIGPDRLMVESDLDETDGDESDMDHEPARRAG